MSLKDRVSLVIKKIGSSKISYTIILISLTVTVFNHFYRPLKKETVNESKVIFNFSSDRRYLDCIYDQLVCYGDHAGEDRDSTLTNCKVVGICDSLK